MTSLGGPQTLPSKCRKDVIVDDLRYVVKNVDNMAASASDSSVSSSELMVPYPPKVTVSGTDIRAKEFILVLMALCLLVCSICLFYKHWKKNYRDINQLPYYAYLYQKEPPILPVHHRWPSSAADGEIPLATNGPCAPSAAMASAVAAMAGRANANFQIFSQPSTTSRPLFGISPTPPKHEARTSISATEDYESELRNKRFLRSQSEVSTKFSPCSGSGSIKKKQLRQNSLNLEMEPQIQPPPSPKSKLNSVAESNKSVKCRLSRIISVDDETNSVFEEPAKNSSIDSSTNQEMSDNLNGTNEIITTV